MLVKGNYNINIINKREHKQYVIQLKQIKDSYHKKYLCKIDRKMYNMISIDKIMEMLDWNNDEEIQKKGIEESKKVKCLRAFVQPDDRLYNKNVWENCAKVIYNRSDEEIEPYLEDLFRWIQDMNWPGAQIVAKRLYEFDDKIELEKVKRNVLKVAKALNDKTWEEYLNNYEDWMTKENIGL